MKISFDSKLFASKVFEFDQYYSVINSSRNNGYIEKNFHSKFFHNRKSCHKSETNLLLIEFNNSIIVLYFKIWIVDDQMKNFQLDNLILISK